MLASGTIVTEFARRVPERNVDVLFMGSDSGLAEMYKLKLELDGYSVQIARPNVDMVRAAQQQLPDLIFLDLGPTTDSLKLIEELRAHQTTSRIPVIILSAFAEAELADQGFRAGSSDYPVQRCEP